MSFRNGLIAARGQILWILLLALSSVAILRTDLDLTPSRPLLEAAP